MKAGIIGVVLLAVGTIGGAGVFAPEATVGAAASQPATQASIADAELERELRELDGRLGQIQDLSARFEQAKHTPLLKAPLESRGEVRVKGGQTRWVTQSPRATVMVTSETELRLYYPQQRLVEVYALDACMGQLASSPMPRLATLTQHFSIQRWGGAAEAEWPAERFVRIEMTPREAWLRPQIERVSVVIDRQSGLAAMVEMKNADGESTVIRFRDVKVNVGLSDEDLELRTPAGTTVSRPMQGEGEP